MILSKVSIAAFMLRIVVKRIHMWIIYLAVGFTVIAGITFFFVSIFQCHPISYFWNKDQEGKCMNVDIVIALVYVYSAFSVISDFTFALLPIFIVWHLKMEKRAKLALIPLLCMGCVFVQISLFFASLTETHTTILTASVTLVRVQASSYDSPTFPRSRTPTFFVRSNPR